MPEIHTRDSREGLCRTCRDRDGCPLPEAEGGVWHCELYTEETLEPRTAPAVRRPPARTGTAPPNGNPSASRTSGNGDAMTDIAQIVDRHLGERGDLIAILEDIQSKYSYLPEDALRLVAERTGRSLTDIYGVATFYRWFSLKPRGRHLVTCCMGTACHVRGAPRVLAELERQLDARAGDTTPDREFTLETQNCLGACALGPIVVADGHYVSNVATSRVPHLLEEIRAGLDVVDVEHDERVFPVEVSCARCNHTLMDPDQRLDGHPAIRLTIAFGQHHGWLLLSSLYGSYTIESQHEIPNDEVVEVFCPHCHAQFTGAGDCVQCGAPMVAMIVRGGGVVQVCTRRGCRSHMLDLTGAKR